MKNRKISNWIDSKITEQGAKTFFDNINDFWEDYSYEVRNIILDDIFSQLKPEKIETIEDLARLLNGNEYYNELKNPYNIDVQKICKENKWIILFPYSDDCLEIRGYIYDEVDAWNDSDYKILKKGEFYADKDEENTYHKAQNDEIVQTDNGDAHIFMKWCPKDNPYTWYIETDYPNVAYFDIHEEDEEDNTWARCCVIDCSSIL